MPTTSARYLHLAVHKVPTGSEGATSGHKRSTTWPPGHPVCAPAAARKHRLNLADTNVIKVSTIIMPARVFAPTRSYTHKHDRLH